MKRKNKLFVRLIVGITACFCSLSVLFAQQISIRVNPEIKFQTIDNFAAADAWSGNFVGKYWDDKEKEQIAEWLFSRDYDEAGNPKGIGLSLWRVNVGAGSWEQNNPDIMPIQRRAESFLTVDGQHYDWGKCAGHRYFMEQAKALGCNNFLLFSNSPLVQYTLNGKGYSSSNHSTNIKPDCYDKYGEYLAKVAAHFVKEGLYISYISPINEPQVNWDSPRQEGSPWGKSDMKKMFVALDKALSGHDELTKVKMLLGEAANLRVMYRQDEGLRKRFQGEDAPDEQVKAFFNDDSPFYIGDLKHLSRIFAGHTYGNHTKNDELREVRANAGKICKQYGVDYHQSEWCMLPNYLPPMDGFTAYWQAGNRGDIQVGLLMGRLIYSDFIDGNAKAWGYWKGMELKGDHALVALHAKDGNIFWGGTVSANKILWALGNYSFFIRPGYKRIELEGADDLDKVVGSAYIAPDESRIVAVFVNSGFDNESIEIQLPKSYSKKIKEATVYRTDQRTDLAKISSSNMLTLNYQIAPRSLTTIVFDLNR